MPPTEHDRRSRRFLATVVSGFALLASTAAASPLPAPSGTPPPASSAGTGTTAHPGAPTPVTFGIQPAGATKTDQRGYFSFNATPGAIVDDHVAVTNYSHQRLTLSLSAAQGVDTRNGGFALEDSSRHNGDVGSWLRLPAATRRLAVPPRNLVIVPFRLTVPANAAPGDHVGGVLVTLTSSAVSASGQRFTLHQQVGARIFLRVAGPLRPHLSVLRLTTHAHTAMWPFRRTTTTVTYRVRNDGNVVLGAHQRVSVGGLFTSSDRGGPDLHLLLPGYSTDVSVDLPGAVPQVWMKTRVKLSPLFLPGTFQPRTKAFVADMHFVAIPWLIVALLLVAGVVFAFARRRMWSRLFASRGIAQPALSTMAVGPGRHRRSGETT